MKKRIQLPSIKDLAKEISYQKKWIEDENNKEYDDAPSIDITLSADDRGFALQIGDNSFYGPAYSFQNWGVSSLYRNSNCREIAKDLIGQCRDLFYS